MHTIFFFEELFACVIGLTTLRPLMHETREFEREKVLAPHRQIS